MNQPPGEEPEWLYEYQAGSPGNTPPTEEAEALDPFTALGLNPLLTDISADATGVMALPDWSAVFATQNLLDHLSFGIADRPDAFEQCLYDALCRAKLEFTLAGRSQRAVPFYYPTESEHLHLALVIHDEFRPPAAVLGLVEDFPTERENPHGQALALGL